MIVFNTTYIVSFEVHDTWLQWISFRYIPTMLSCGLFENPRLFKVLVGENEEVTYSLQFSTKDMNTIHQWESKFKEETERDFRDMFGESVLFFSTFLEEIK